MIYVYSNGMGRRKKQAADVREPISGRVLPALAAQIRGYAAIKELTPSQAVERLLDRGLLAMEDDSDEDLKTMVDVWRSLSIPLRLHVLETAQSAYRAQSNYKVH